MALFCIQNAKSVIVIPNQVQRQVIHSDGWLRLHKRRRAELSFCADLIHRQSNREMIRPIVDG
jgi:hypothetical protein